MIGTPFDEVEKAITREYDTYIQRYPNQSKTRSNGWILPAGTHLHYISLQHFSLQVCVSMCYS
jgi:hypothetical protein